MANFNLNKVILGGRLTTAPELKQTQSGISVCSFVIAVNRPFTKDKDVKADFFNVTAWRTQAELVARYFNKGSSICVVGSIQNRTWTDPKGEKHYATDIMADEINFVDSKGDVAPVPTEAATTQKPEKQSYSTAGGAAELREIKSDDDLPF